MSTLRSVSSHVIKDLPRPPMGCVFYYMYAAEGMVPQFEFLHFF
jgi:hypothetical protein